MGQGKSYLTVITQDRKAITPNQVREALKDHPTAEIVVSRGWFDTEIVPSQFQPVYRAARKMWDELKRELEAAGVSLIGGGASAREAWFANVQMGTPPVTPPIPPSNFNGEAVTPPKRYMTTSSVRHGRSVTPTEKAPPLELQAEGDGTLESRIRELAGQELGYRKIAAQLQLEGINASHMKVARVLRKGRRKDKLW